jgi:pimeloyl-ACP methyl ester carboxylesterase
MARSPRMGWKILGWTLVLATVLAVALAGVGLYFSTLLTTPDEPWSSFDKQVTAADDGTVELTWDSDTDLAGRNALLWDSGHAVLGEQIGTSGERDSGTITYEVADVARGDLTVPLDAAWYSWFYEGTPADRGLSFREVTPRSDVGDLPSWYLPGSSDTWVIAVHGINGDREEALRILPTLVEAGTPTLVIRYRNDTGVPTTDNLLRLGDAEWRDVQAAMEWATQRGAERFVLYGFSFGAQVSLQTLARAQDRDRVVGMVLDGPVISWRSTLDFQAGLRGLPTVISWAGGIVTELRLDIDLDDFDWIARSEELDVPILVFHGPDDDYVPWEPSRELADLRPDIVTLEQVDEAGHTRSWNVAPTRYEGAVSAFLTDVDARVPTR